MSTSVVARRICATPVRSASEVWQLITSLVADSNESARRELEAIGGVAMSIIAAEAPQNSPIILSGVGPQLRLYCLYDDEAIIGQDASEDSLSWNPTDGDWRLSLPCPLEDLDWVTAELSAVSNRVVARDLSDALVNAATEVNRSNRELGPINVEAFRQR